MANENPSFYAIIPANVRYDNTIVANAKLLFGEITALSDKHGYCFATNDYFAELYNRDGKTISRWITSLKNAGYIDVEYFYRGAEVTERRIYLSDSRVIKSSLKVQKSHSTGDENITRTGDEKVTDINTSIITTSKDTIAADAALEPITKDQSLHHRLVSYFDSGYKTVHHEKMDWSKKELACVKNIITKAKSSGEDPEIILRRKLKMFQDNFQMPDDWYAKAPFTPSFFLYEWPKLNERRTPITKSDRARMENDMSVEEMIRDSVEKAEKKKLERAGTR